MKKTILKENKGKEYTGRKRCVQKIGIVTGVLLSIFLILFVFCFNNYITAETQQGKLEQDKEALKDNQVVKVKEISGEVSGISSKYITIIYSRDEEKGVENEIYLYLSDDVEILHKKSLKEIAVGDTVKITYEEASKKLDKVKDDGSLEQITTITDRKVKTIAFIRSAMSNTSSK